MRIAVYSNAQRVDHGGGVTYSLALASALAAANDVDLVFPFEVSEDCVLDLMPPFGSKPRITRTPEVRSLRLVGSLQRALKDRRYDMVVVQSPHVPRATLCPRAYALCEFPFARTTSWTDRVRLGTFGRVVANSNFTARWIERRWGRTASVLYPPIRVIQELPKQPYILAVGRFIGGGRSKRQAEMVAMFRTLCERGLRGWELHLAGFVHDRAYADRVTAAADGLPVRFHFNADRSQLEELYGRSAIFWHATGAGVNAEEEPERMEHFGIVTVEAMSAGCVPVVIDGGGQPEIVCDQGVGILWKDFDACVEDTLALARDETKRRRMAEAARERAAAFAFPKFAERVHELFIEGRAA